MQTAKYPNGCEEWEKGRRRGGAGEKRGVRKVAERGLLPQLKEKLGTQDLEFLYN